MPTAHVGSAMDAIQHFQERSIKIVCTTAQNGAAILHQADLRRAIFLIIGGERRGIAQHILDHADLLLRIPYARDFDNSLGATAATSIIAFEVARQRKVGE